MVGVIFCRARHGECSITQRLFDGTAACHHLVSIFQLDGIGGLGSFNCDTIGDRIGLVIIAEHRGRDRIDTKVTEARRIFLIRHRRLRFAAVRRKDIAVTEAVFHRCFTIYETTLIDRCSYLIGRLIIGDGHIFLRCKG